MFLFPQRRITVFALKGEDMEFKILYNLEDNHKHQSIKGRLAVQMFYSFPTVLSTPKQLCTRLRNDRAHPPFFPLVSIYINSFFMDIRFEFQKSNQQKVGPFCFQIFAMLLVPYLLLHTLVGYPCGGKIMA